MQIDENFDSRKKREFYHWVQSGRYDRAVAAGQECLALDPRDASIHSSMGEILMALGKEAEAREHYTTSLSIDPEDARTRALLSLAELRRTMPSFALAEKGAIDALAQDPDNWDAWYALGWATCAYDEEFAMQCCDRVLLLEPDNDRGYLQKAHFLSTFTPKRLSEAESMLTHALSLAPEDPAVHDHVANFYLFSKNDENRAMHHISISLNIDPTNENALALNDHIKMRRSWVAKFLRFPWMVAQGTFSLIGQLCDTPAIYVTWPIALWAVAMALWLAVIWVITMFPLLKLYEWLLVRALEFHRNANRLAFVFGASEPIRWLVFVTVSALYLSGLWVLRLMIGGEAVEDVLGMIVVALFFGVLPLAFCITLWERYRKRALHERIGNTPPENE